MCSAETDMWNSHLEELLAHFVDEFDACGGTRLDVDVLTGHVVLYAAVMCMTWLLDVPGYVRAQAPDLTARSTRMDPAIRNLESARCRLQMLTNALNLLQRNDLGRILDDLL
jgi:hypothetical protein